MTFSSSDFREILVSSALRSLSLEISSSSAAMAGFQISVLNVYVLAESSVLIFQLKASDESMVNSLSYFSCFSQKMTKNLTVATSFSFGL